MFGSCAFRNHHHRSQATSSLPHLYYVSNLFVIKRDFGNQNHISAAGDATLQCNPAGMASHHFHHHHSPVTCRGSVQSVERIYHHVNGGIESECRGGGFKIVVDRLWDADAIDARFLQLLRRHQ